MPMLVGRPSSIILSSDQALRIKTDAAATGSTVTNITYSVSPQLMV